MLEEPSHEKLVVLEHISLDGVIQAPGGPEEAPAAASRMAAGSRPLPTQRYGTLLRRQMNLPFDLLLGRRTYDIWAPYWPQHGDVWPRANATTKYVASNTLASGDWQPTVVLSGDVVAQVAHIKQQPGPDLHVWGSSNLLQTLPQA